MSGGEGALDTPGPLNGIEQSECPNAELEGGMGGFASGGNFEEG